MTVTRRLAKLEAARPNREPDYHDRWVYQLCEGSPILGAIRDAAQTRAVRRALAEDRYPNPMFALPGIDELARIEEAELARFWEASGGDLWQAIRDWIAEPDTLGWPRKKTGAMHPVSDTENFFLTLRSRRQVVESNRASHRAAGWRKDNPTWRPGMDDDEFYQWDLDRLDRAAAAGLW